MRRGIPVGFAQESQNVSFFPISISAATRDIAMGIPLNEMVVWDPYMLNGGA